jgi:transposase
VLPIGNAGGPRGSPPEGRCSTHLHPSGKPLQAAYLERLRASDEAIGAAYELSQRFVEMIRDLNGERVEEWLAQADSCEAPALRRFAVSLKTDLAAVRAGLTESWNNGPVEGFIHKLKLVKRQGYGRANIDLLKARVMAA